MDSIYASATIASSATANCKWRIDSSKVAVCKLQEMSSNIYYRNQTPQDLTLVRIAKYLLVFRAQRVKNKVGIGRKLKRNFVDETQRQN